MDDSGSTSSLETEFEGSNVSDSKLKKRESGSSFEKSKDSSSARSFVPKDDVMLNINLPYVRDDLGCKDPKVFQDPIKLD